MKKDLMSLYFLSDKFDELLYNKAISLEERQSILESIYFLERKIEEKYARENTIIIPSTSNAKPRKKPKKKLS